MAETPASTAVVVVVVVQPVLVARQLLAQLELQEQEHLTALQGLP
jgi:hypothetical protein